MAQYGVSGLVELFALLVCQKHLETAMSGCFHCEITLK